MSAWCRNCCSTCRCREQPGRHRNRRRWHHAVAGRADRPARHRAGARHRSARRGRRGRSRAFDAARARHGIAIARLRCRRRSPPQMAPTGAAASATKCSRPTGADVLVADTSRAVFRHAGASRRAGGAAGGVGGVARGAHGVWAALRAHGGNYGAARVRRAGALRGSTRGLVFDATPDEAGGDVAIDHAGAAASGLGRGAGRPPRAAVRNSRSALAAHHGLVCCSPSLEMEPPRECSRSRGATIAAQVGAASSDARPARSELDLGKRRRDRGRLPSTAGSSRPATLTGRGVRALRLSTADESDAWLALPARVARSA